MAPLSHKFVVFEASAAPKTERAWRLNIQLDGKLLKQDQLIRDPFFNEEHERISYYLECLLAQKDDPKHQASLDSDLLDSCRRSLFTNLFSQLNLEKSLHHPHIHIDIHEREKPSPSSQPATIHWLPWELLESSDLWPVDGAQITVRRIVSPIDLILHGVKPVSSWSMNDNRQPSINILVVIARRLSTRHDGQYEDLDPFVALNAILKVEKELKHAGIRLNVAVVRPGSFEELVAYLGDHGHGYFHMIHFDVHGEVGKDNIAYLHFAIDDPLTSDPKGLAERSAEDVATVVESHGISCVVLNACESATANKGFNANLSRIFGQHGISNVLAMSYKFSVSAAKIFHVAFYQAFLIKAVPFSEAASYARHCLRQNQNREAARHRTCDIQDWFVPVVYSNGKDTKLNIPERPEPGRAFMTHPKLSRNCFISIYKGVNRCIRIGHLFFACLGPLSLNCKAGYRQLSDEHTPPPPVYDPPVPERAGDILRLERDITVDGGHLVFLCGPPKAGKSMLLRCVQHLWLSTHFCDRVYYINAERFLESCWATRVIRPLTRGWSYDDGLSYRFRPLRGCNDDESSPPRTAIIIDQLDDLYPPNPTQRQVRGQQRFQRYLSRATDGFDRGGQSQRPYIILVSRHNDADWWRQCVPELADHGSLLFRALPNLIDPL